MDWSNNFPREDGLYQAVRIVQIHEQFFIEEHTVIEINYKENGKIIICTLLDGLKKFKTPATPEDFDKYLFKKIPEIELHEIVHSLYSK